MALMITSPHKKLKSKIESKPRDTLKKKQKNETFFIMGPFGLSLLLLKLKTESTVVK